VLNKVDCLDEVGRRRLGNRFPDAPQVSAATGEGLEELKALLADRFGDRWERVRLLIPYDQGGRLSELYSLGTPIEEREDTAGGVLVIARLPRRDLPRFAPFLMAEARAPIAPKQREIV
jgi:GTPase